MASVNSCIPNTGVGDGADQVLNTVSPRVTFADFTEASSVYDTTGMSKHRLESHINAYYLD